MSNYSSQLQLAQIAEKIELVQKLLRKLDMVKSMIVLLQLLVANKNFTSYEISRSRIEKVALLRIAMDAEDSRNLLMQSQRQMLTL